jgi:hypothetical protein
MFLETRLVTPLKINNLRGYVTSPGKKICSLYMERIVNLKLKNDVSEPILLILKVI